MMEVYPFHHKNLVFYIVTEYDLTFREVRDLLDHLLDRHSFDQEDREVGALHSIQLNQVLYEVDVNGYEVVVYRRTELKETQ